MTSMNLVKLKGLRSVLKQPQKPLTLWANLYGIIVVYSEFICQEFERKI